MFLAVGLYGLGGEDGRPPRRREAGPASASADLFVAADGNDAWSGTLPAPNSTNTDGPLASVARAQILVRSLVRSSPNRPVTVMLRAGTYYLPLSHTSPGTLQFTSSDSGTSTTPVIWENYPGEIPILSGGEPVGKGGLGLNWTNVSGSLWQAHLPAGTQPFEYLFYNGERRLRSRLESPAGTGYYMKGGVCYGTVENSAVATSLCNLGTYLRVADTIAPTDPGGAGCPTVTNSTDSTMVKCLDRFKYNPSDPVAAWQNLNPTAVAGQTCTLAVNNSYPQGDIELTLFDAWTVDVMRVSCVDTANRIIFLTAPAKGTASQYNFFGPVVGHRYVVENAKDAFTAAQSAGLGGVWFLDRSTTPWTLNYLAQSGENPNTDSVVIAQLEPVSDIGGSLLSATGLNYVTFRGITFEVDNYMVSATGFNTDENSDDVLPEAIDCESCQDVIFDGITVRHTSASGILIASTSGERGTPASNDVIENSAFYDIGDCGIRIGHHPYGSDTPAYVVQFVTVQNNIVQGYSRVFADGEGIAQANGHDILYSHNDINDGYHAGISVCLLSCFSHSANGTNIVSQYNHIWNTMQGATSDGGTLYYNVGGADGSGTGDKILNNLVHDTTDSAVIDGAACGGRKCAGTSYGGNGIYLDIQSAGVDVENNVVYRVSDTAAWISGGPSPGMLPNTFRNNIFAFARNNMFVEAAPWAQGCASAALRVSFTNNIFYFDLNDTSGFYFNGGCPYSCGLAYNAFQDFQSNLYWRTDGGFANYSKAFHVLTATPADPTDCNSTAGESKSWTFLNFSQWQANNAPSGVTWLPSMSEDAGGAVKVNPGFGNTGQPGDFLLSTNLVSGFDYTKTNDTILHAGRTDPAIMPPAVPPTLPNYRFTQY
jgi:hypothetical protein